MKLNEQLADLVGLTPQAATQVLQNMGMHVKLTNYFTDKQDKWDTLLVICARQISHTEVELIIGNFLLDAEVKR